MNALAEQIFSSDEKDILQEVMNIAFGQATAELAEVIDIFVILSVPYIKVIEGSDLPGYFLPELDGSYVINLIEQNFIGKFSGQALLIFPSGAEKELIKLFNQENEAESYGVDIDTLERETLLEVGNILIGACIGKITELLNDCVTYDPPRLVLQDLSQASPSQFSIEKDSYAISIRTVFRFEQQNVEGYLFLITRQRSIQWLKKALQSFLESCM